VLPLMENSLPLTRLCTEGQLRLLTPQQILVECSSSKAMTPGRSLAVGVSGPNDTKRFAPVVVDQVRPINPTQSVLVGHLGGALSEILAHDVLRPAFNPQSLRLEYSISARILNRLADAHVLARTIVDRLHLCPRCGGLPNYRSVCHACSSPLVLTDELIHHYACAHVGPVKEFRQGDHLRCPKCQIESLIVGADYEFLPGLYKCLECSRTGSQLQMRGSCLVCQHDFTIGNSNLHDVVGFRPNRLEIAHPVRV
jgi:hypothetical protein